MRGWVGSGGFPRVGASALFALAAAVGLSGAVAADKNPPSNQPAAPAPSATSTPPAASPQSPASPQTSRSPQGAASQPDAPPPTATQGDPLKGPAERWKAKKAAPAQPVKLVDINHASRAELKTLPGIGDAEADRIIAGRPYHSKVHLATRDVLPTGVYLSIRRRIVADQTGVPPPKK